MYILPVLIITAIPYDFIHAQEKLKQRPKVGLALSGGGAKGLAHIGVLKVLEEAGIEVDFITGTSMGGIVGGLYAIGYDAKTLENFAIKENWSELMSDEISLRNIAINEKNEDSKYIITFSMKGLHIEIPKGLIKGQKLSSTLTMLTLPYHHIDDFSKLPIPFHCIATDLETGEAVVLSKGYLPDAMRASMSIPSIFIPIEIDGRLLVDGYVVRNFPVSDLKKMGADIIIGVDVGAPLYKKNEIDSLAKILEQSVSFLGEKSVKQERQLCNILILPEIKGLGSSDFDLAREIIKRGEDAARAKLLELEKLSRQLDEFPKREKRNTIQIPKNSQIYVKDIRVEGVKRVTKTFIKSKLDIHIPSRITMEKLESAIQDLYGSKFFERITYRILPLDEGSLLLIRVEEKETNLIRFGLSYDTYLKAAVLANLTIRNLLGQGSILYLTGRLSEYPGFLGSYMIITGLRPGIGIGTDVSMDRYNVLTYRFENNAEHASASYTLTNYMWRVLLQTVYSSFFALGTGIEKEYSIVRPDITSPFVESRDTESMNYMVYLRIDTLDRYYYPRSGIQCNLEAKLITDNLPLKRREGFAPFYKYIASTSVFIPFHRRVTFFTSLHGGVIRGVRIPYGYVFYLGGAFTFNRDFFPFPGLNLMEVSGKNAFVFQTGLQIQLWSNIYLIPRGSVGKASDAFSALFTRDRVIYAGGMTLGINTLIGPIETTIMWGGKRDEFIYYVNIGYRF